MLTRHLYRFDEVRASFLYCLRQRRYPEVFFWLEELEESFYGGEARRLLLVAWTFFVGLRRLSWLVAWSKEGQTREGRLRLTWLLFRCSERDSSLAWLLWAGALVENPCSRLVQGWREVASLESSEAWETIVNQSTDERLDECMEALQTDLRGYSSIGRLVGWACTATKPCPGTWSEGSDQKAPDFDEIVPGWKEGSLRKQRVYPIPHDALFGMCLRGRGADTRAELLELGEEQFKSSPFWKRFMPLDSDSAKETFWHLHFPWVTCDHPDEWSLADQGKSHGEGVGVHGGSAPLWRWWKAWVREERLYVWGKDADSVKTWVQTQRADTGASVLDAVLELYKSSNLESIPKPVELKREFILAT